MKFYIFICIISTPLLIVAQQKTHVPDDNFEDYLEYNGIGDGIFGNDSVLTSNIASVLFIYANNENISDLTGINDFLDLQTLWINDNNISNLTINNLNDLDEIECNNNQLTSITLNNLPSLSSVSIVGNSLSTLDLSTCPNLSFLNCDNNQLTYLDISQHPYLMNCFCNNNMLTSINMHPHLSLLYCSNNNLTTLVTFPGMNNLDCSNNNLSFLQIGTPYTFGSMISSISTLNNPNLYCISVYDSIYSSTNWIGANFSYDPQNYFSTTCNYNGSIDCNLINVQLSIDTNNNDLLCNATNNIPNSFTWWAWIHDANGQFYVFLPTQSTTIPLPSANPNDTFEICLSASILVQNINSSLNCVHCFNLILGDNNYWTIDILTNTSTNEQIFNTNKQLLKIVDVLGRETPNKKNIPLFYIYRDGTVEKRILIE